MTDLIIEKKNEVYMTLIGEQSTLQELQDVFTFYADGYKFHPKVKARIWDGKIRILKLLSRNRGELYLGLLEQVIKFCNDRNYTYELHSNLTDTQKIDKKKLEEFANSINISSKKQKIELRDYQLKGFIDAINNKRNIILAPTSCLDPESLINCEISDEAKKFLDKNYSNR